MCYHILIIDDDDRIRDLLKKYLIKNGFLVSSVSNAAKARKIMEKYIFDLMIVDYMMPNESGIEFLTSIRKQENNTPAIMLTALGEIENRIEGLTAGADDYLPKPFEPKELVLRINNILKRINKNNGEDIFIFDDFQFNIKKNELYKKNKFIKLTDVEIKIFNIFVKNANIILTREELCNLLDNVINERTIDVQITRLRKKIENEPKNPKFLKTIRNKGYLFSI